jgi:hypothetical protein
MPQIVDARGVVSPTVAPAQALAQFFEDAMYLALAQWQSPPSTARADEEGGVLLRGLPGQVTS